MCFKVITNFLFYCIVCFDFVVMCLPVFLAIPDSRIVLWFTFNAVVAWLYSLVIILFFRFSLQEIWCYIILKNWCRESNIVFSVWIWLFSVSKVNNSIIDVTHEKLFPFTKTLVFSIRTCLTEVIPQNFKIVSLLLRNVVANINFQSLQKPTILRDYFFLSKCWYPIPESSTGLFSVLSNLQMELTSDMNSWTSKKSFIVSQMNANICFLEMLRTSTKDQFVFLDTVNLFVSILLLKYTIFGGTRILIISMNCHRSHYFLK